jgi:DNA-binding NtrC family response regulator
VSEYIHKSHNVKVLIYHLGFPAKYRRVVFDDDVEGVLKEVCLEIEKRYQVKFVDLKMPGINGEETLKALKAEHKWMEVIILTGHGTIDSAVELTKMGAYAYLQKPCSLDELMDSLKEAYKKKVMNKKNIADKKMDELLEVSKYGSAREILRRLRELDKG